MNDQEMKVCRECQMELPVGQFSTKPNGYVFPRCKTCMRGAKRTSKKCKNCGAEFPATTRTAKLYCSNECKRAYEAEKAKAERIEKSVKREKDKTAEIRLNKRNNPEAFDRYRHLPTTRSEALRTETTQYFTGLKCANGHLAPKYAKNRLCAECMKERRAESVARRIADGRYAEQQRRSNAKNRQRRVQDEEYRQRRLCIAKEWQSRNREHLAAYMQRQRDENPQFLIQQRLQTRLNRVLRRAGTQRSQKMDRYVGCTSDELVAHLESQFDQTMSWETKGEWHIDHIRPCSSFDLTDEEQVKVCFNWRNLQPLDGVENKSKQGKYEIQDEKSWIERMRELGYEGRLYARYES